MSSFEELIKKIYRDNSINLQNCDSISLALTKLIEKDIIENTKAKIRFLNSFTNVNFSNYNAFKPYKITLKRFQEQVNSLAQNQGYELVYSDKISTQSRLIVGLGSQHVLETSITLHHIFGVPYIPGSALKGVCRMVAFWKLADMKGINNVQEKFEGDLVKDDEEILKYQILFGAQNFKGLLLFLDAYPTENNREIFDLDIMTPHYREYYSDKEGKVPPGDWENPLPIVFLTLKEGVEFNFNVLFDKFRAENILKFGSEELNKLKILEKAKDILRNFCESKNLEKEIKELLEEALKNFGIGAKTRLGYGIF